MSHRPDLFHHVMTHQRTGLAAEELSAELAKAVAQARLTGKKATLTLTLTIEPQGQSGQYFVRDAIKTRLPELAKETTLFFGTPEGNLTRSDPRQAELNIRSVPDDKPATPKQLGA